MIKKIRRDMRYELYNMRDKGNRGIRGRKILPRPKWRYDLVRIIFAHKSVLIFDSGIPIEK